MDHKAGTAPLHHTSRSLHHGPAPLKQSSVL